MAAQGQSRFWRRCRTGFRWCRIAVWVVVLFCCCALAYLSEIGLPDFARQPVRDTLRARGLDLEFSRLRLRWFRGVVADDVRFGKPNDSASPRLSAEQVELGFNVRELLRRRLRIDSVGLHQGRFAWPLTVTNGTERALAVENIDTTLRLLPDDQWSLDDFRGKFGGMQFTLSAVVNHATAIRDWKFLHTRVPTEPEAWQKRLQRLSEVIEKISFTEPPELHVIVGGDARDPQSFSGRLILHAPGADTPWGKAARVLVIAKLVPGASNEVLRTEIRVDASQVQTRWGNGNEIHLNTTGILRSETPPMDPAYGWLTNLYPYRFDWSLETDAVHANGLDIQKLALAGQWEAPQFSITDLHAEWPEGDVDAHVRVDVPTRVANFDLISSVDLNRVSPLLTEKTRIWLTRFSWANAPHLKGSGSAVLPAWTDRQPDWRGEVQPTLQLAGEFAVTNCAYQGVAANWAQSHFTYTNMVWHLPDLEIGRPEGQLHLVHEEDDRTKDYRWQIRGSIDPRALAPLLATNAQHGLDLAKFTTPPLIDGEIRGRLYDYDTISARARVSVTNVSFREQTADYVEAEVSYTNLQLTITAPHVWRNSGQVLTASVVRVDFPAQRVYISNGYSTTDPMQVARAIGPKTAHAVESYHFLKPPIGWVYGYASFQGEKDTDLHFSVEGGPFETWRFAVKWIKGDIHWQGKFLALTNVQAPFYEGEASGSAFFDFRPVHGANFNFFANVTDADLHALVEGVAGHTNNLEGRLTGTLMVTHGSTADKQSWRGFGHARLRDGLIWDIPIFGVLSPVLNEIVPGVGTSRASEAAADFVITNSVVRTEQLEIKSPMLRLQYAGTVDYEGRVDARVEAEPLRDAWFVGRIVNIALTPVTKLLQYQITGTITQPKSEPVYIPKAFLFPLHPIRTLEELFPEEPPVTNAPPVLILPPATNALPVAIVPPVTNALPAELAPSVSAPAPEVK